jgi:hypothetical protein
VWLNFTWVALPQVRFMNNNVEGNGIRDAGSAQQLISQVQFNGMTCVSGPLSPDPHPLSFPVVRQ